MGQLDDLLISQGRYIVTTDDIEGTIGPSPNPSGRLAGLRRQRRLVSAAKGLYLVIPAEYRNWGSLPADWFIDALMHHLDRQYYVGLLSAAAIHGASHQASQVLQVMVDERVRARTLGRVKLRFYRSGVLKDMIGRQGVERRPTHTGEYSLSSPELTVIDLVEYQRNAGGLNNIATVLSELEGLQGDVLSRLAEGRRQSVIRRLGWFLDRYGHTDQLDSVAALVLTDREHPTPLEPGGSSSGVFHPRWNLLENAEIEPDL
ncbi:MAG: type IV toxin-antitoxin system AbiEi family antitoxin domain-containing protein [Chloroflexota bacterium]